MSIKCNNNFESQYAYIDNIPIHINNYKENFLHRKNDLYCSNNHKLESVIGSHRKSYFRHSNSNDVLNTPISEWHCAWQGEFEITEYNFNKLPNQIKARRADAFIKNHNLVIEFQHSHITKEEVDYRKQDRKSVV